ncbi:hypothetical protein ACFR99_13895 [Haloarchaeobius amylolyticus]|uniref:Uncharacterized protein n=1 Tax=Haloarchaeobius amylolyticus TaxID=1198296 RepID=A0ABD6BIW1_9EURY
MSESYSLTVLFFIDELQDDVRFVQRTVELLRENGIETVSEAQDETATRYEIDGEEQTGSLADAATDIANGKDGRIPCRIDDYRVEVRFDLDAMSGDETDVALTFRGPDESAFDEDDVSRAVVRDRADRLADAIAALAIETDPWLVVGWIPYPYADSHPFPEGRPPKSGLERLGWVTVFGDPFHGRFGGRERLLEAPAWNVRDLANGAVLVRQQETPGTGRSDATPRPEPSTYDYLFEGESLADLQAEIDRQKSTYIDPFRDLDNGELASDIVMCEAHAPFEFEEMEYTSFPDDLDRSDRCHVLCVRRDGDKLWEANNDEFIRRLVDADGHPIGELPEAVPPDQEMISLLVTTEYDGDSSLDLYRMESPDDPSVTAGLLGLQRVDEGESIWQDRDDPVMRQ